MLNRCKQCRRLMRPNRRQGGDDELAALFCSCRAAWRCRMCGGWCDRPNVKQCLSCVLAYDAFSNAMASLTLKCEGLGRPPERRVEELAELAAKGLPLFPGRGLQ